MNVEAVTDYIKKSIERMCLRKGLPPVPVAADDRFLGGTLPMDSLDLAVLVTELEEFTKKQPFQQGFRNFRTVEELAQLYAD
jgi:acyl carrier protein